MTVNKKVVNVGGGLEDYEGEYEKGEGKKGTKLQPSLLVRTKQASAFQDTSSPRFRFWFVCHVTAQITIHNAITHATRRAVGGVPWRSACNGRHRKKQRFP